MEIIDVKNPVYATEDKLHINCDVTFDNGKIYPYTSNAVDKEEHGVQLWTDLNAGKYGDIAPYE